MSNVIVAGTCIHRLKNKLKHPTFSKTTRSMAIRGNGGGRADLGAIPQAVTPHGITSELLFY